MGGGSEERKVKAERSVGLMEMKGGEKKWVVGVRIMEMKSIVSCKEGKKKLKQERQKYKNSRRKKTQS